MAKPSVWDPLLELLAQRGTLHERGYVAHLQETGLSVTVIEGVGINSDAVAQTFEAMQGGVPIIVQGALQSGRWSGRTDILRRVERPSHLGAWSYEVIDTKLARETKGNTVLQICLYSDLLSEAQKLAPEFAYVVVPGTRYEPQQFRIADYAAYYRRVRKSLERAVTAAIGDDNYPEPKPHCDICRWRRDCDAKWRADDHLCLVAGISKSQIGELKRRAITTTAEFAAVPLPLSWKPDRGAASSYERIREQARIQVQGRREKKMIYEALAPEPGFGLACLPPPSSGDVFFDLEGDPFVGEGGLEFLFGYRFRAAMAENYVADWALSRAEEKAAFERFVDFAIGRLR